MELGHDPLNLTGFPPALADWVVGQRLALGSALLRIRPRPRTDEQKSVFEHVWPRRLTDSPVSLVKRLRQLPPAALEGLNSLTPVQRSLWSDYAPLWQQALATAKWNDSKRRSPIAGAKLIANRLLRGALKPAQFPRLAALEMRARAWPETPAFKNGLKQLMDDLRVARKAEGRVDALTGFRSRVDQLPASWRMVENAILQQSFAWPLLILTSPEKLSTYCTLPLAVDVVLNSRPLPPAEEVALRQFEQPKGEPPIVEAEAWRRSVRRALSAAKDLWLYKHPDYHLGFARMIENASVTLDLRVTEAIVAPYGGWGRFALDGESLEVYLALIILGRFLDSPVMETVCATGRLGTKKRNGRGSDSQPGGDWSIETIGHPALKVRCAAVSFFFDQVIVPAGQVPQTRIPHLKVSEGSLLSHYADHVFGDQWRRHRWIRCPDLAAAFKTAPRPGDEADEVDLVLTILDGNTDPVVELHPSISALSVVRALKRVNDLTTKRPEKKHGSRKWQRQGSFTVIRTADLEINERFWQVVWDALGADSAQFESFCHLVSLTTPGQIFSEQMNRFIPSEKHPRRAPDVLVIVGSARLETGDSMATGPFSRLAIKTVLAAANDGLLASRIGDLRRIIGATRVILAPHDWMPEGQAELGAAPPSLRRAVQRLSIFRHGFTFQMARKMLGLDEVSTLETLRALQRPKADGAPWLSYGVSDRAEFPPDAAYEYFLTEKAALPEDREALAQLHFDAANAILGFLEPAADAARFDFNTALSPVWLHEAQNQFRAAWHNRDLHGRDLPEERERLSRVGEPFGWSAVRWAARYSKETHSDMLEAVKDHIDRRAVSTLLHPLELTWAAKLSFRLDQRDNQGDEHFRKRMLSLAWSACDRLATEEEQAACRFIVATTRAFQKMKISPNEGGMKWAEKDNQDALALLSTGSVSEILDPEWFDFMGDAEWDHAKAAALYRRGVWNDAIRGAGHSGGGAALVKYFGACHLARIPVDEKIQIEFAKDQPLGMVKHIYDHHDRLPSGLFGMGAPRHRATIQDRWRVGRNIFLERHLKSAPTRGALGRTALRGRERMEAR